MKSSFIISSPGNLLLKTEFKSLSISITLILFVTLISSFVRAPPPGPISRIAVFLIELAISALIRSLIKKC